MPKKNPAQTNVTDPSYPLKLTFRQREAMIRYLELPSHVDEKLKSLGGDIETVPFTWTDLEHISDDIYAVVKFARGQSKYRLRAIEKKVERLLNEQPHPSGLKLTRPDDDADLLFQFKITLAGMLPTIWRRIQIKDGTLADLHIDIQTAFGWENYHMHQFEIDGLQYGLIFDDGFDMDTEDESAVRLCDLLPKSAKRTRWMYEYDFGDGWRHEILFEGYPTKEKQRRYPICIDGARACPPEDIGGPYGYANFLDAITDQNHEEHEDFMEWGGPFDPEAFDAKAASRSMRQA